LAFGFREDEVAKFTPCRLLDSRDIRWQSFAFRKTVGIFRKKRQPGKKQSPAGYSRDFRHRSRQHSRTRSGEVHYEVGSHLRHLHQSAASCLTVSRCGRVQIAVFMLRLSPSRDLSIHWRCSCPGQLCRCRTLCRFLGSYSECE
jgi:hypothetical protein